MKIVLTGGPSAGKTTVAMSLIKHYYHHLALVPEAATILYRGGFPRASRSEEARLCQQRAIFKVQKELETLVGLEWPGKNLICDRGTLDGLAYWPGKASLFFEQNFTSMDEELSRYDIVIHLEVAQQEDYNSDHSDVRVESHEKALEIDEKIKKAWSSHPHRYIVHNDTSFVDKISKVHQLIEKIILINGVQSITGGDL